MAGEFMWGEDWMVFGSCRDTGAAADEWFPEVGSSSPIAKRICRDCPVRYECLTYALVRKEQYGIWAGFSARQLRAMTLKMSDADIVNLVMEEST